MFDEHEHEGEHEGEHVVFTYGEKCLEAPRTSSTGLSRGGGWKKEYRVFRNTLLGGKALELRRGAFEANELYSLLADIFDFIFIFSLVRGRAAFVRFPFEFFKSEG